MKKTVTTFACLCMMAGLLAGCSMNKDSEKAGEDVNKSAQRAVDDTKDAADKAKNDVDDSIDNVMNYFKTNGIAYENMQNIENMEFAAHEGRSFMMNGNTVYLYRVKSDDENMKKIMKEAKDNGKVKVRIDNKEQEYAAQVNGSYLMLYDTKADYSDIAKLFPKYQQTGVHGTDPNEDMNNKKTNMTGADADNQDGSSSDTTQNNNTSNTEE